MLSKSQNYEVSPKKIQINFILSTILKIRKINIKYMLLLRALLAVVFLSFVLSSFFKIIQFISFLIAIN